MTTRPDIGAPSPAYVAFADRLGLDELDRGFLWAALGFAYEPRLALQADALGARAGLTPALYAELVDLPAGRGEELAMRLANRGALTHHRLLRVVDPRVVPALRSYVPPARLLAHLRGDTRPPTILTSARREADWQFDDAQRAALGELEQALVSAVRPVVLIEGAPESGRRSAIAHVVGAPVVVLDLARVAAADLEAALDALALEPRLGEVLPVIANLDTLSTTDPLRGMVARFLDSHPGPIAATAGSTRYELPIDRAVVRVTWPLAAASTRRALWEAAAPDASGDLDDLAYRYRLGPGAIQRAVRVARSTRGPLAPLDPHALLAAARYATGERMAGVAQHVDVTQSWADLVLDEEISAQVKALIARVRHGRTVLDAWGYRDKLARGTGVAAMFSGPPGTGKTMVAGLIAKELGLELYQVDLSQIVSKWVGETEKQLGRVFDAAEGGHALLLFDEADALFGQRSTEAKSANDRYANLEVNYLLQRIEAFNGVTILTTNLDANVDSALKRRLAAHVVFSTPDEEQRAELWQRLLATPRAPLGRDLDAVSLARTFPTMSGANIRNAVLGAAFLAAAENARSIDHAHAARAARNEYRSMGHVLSDLARPTPSIARKAR